MLFYSRGDYKLNGRARHSTAVISDLLYLWAGDQTGCPGVHDSAEKRETMSNVQIFSLPSGKWQLQVLPLWGCGDMSAVQ